MKIAYVCENYHWESYTVVRSLLELLKRKAEVVACRRVQDAPNDVDQIWIASSSLPIGGKTGKFTVAIGFSDPSRFKLARLKAVDLYATQSKRVAEKYPRTYHLPLFADKRYFVPMPVKKEWDCVFIGLGEHQFVTNRVQVVGAVREKGVRVRVYGAKWPKHVDNRPFVSGPKLIKVFNSAHLALDVSNTTVSIGSRIFQAAMCGTPVITRARDDVAELFTPDREIFFYRRDSALPNLVKSLLRDKAHLRCVGEAARQRAIQDHDAALRLDTLFAWANEAYAEWKK